MDGVLLPVKNKDGISETICIFCLIKLVCHFIKYHLPISILFPFLHHYFLRWFIACTRLFVQTPAKQKLFKSDNIFTYYKKFNAMVYYCSLDILWKPHEMLRRHRYAANKNFTIKILLIFLSLIKIV